MTEQKLKEVMKIYKKLSTHSNPEIAREASIQLWFESGGNTFEAKQKARIKSMAQLSILMIFESKKNDPELGTLASNTFINAYEKLN